MLSLPVVGNLKAGGCDGLSWKKIRTKISWKSVILEVETRVTGCIEILMCPPPQKKKYFPLHKTEWTRQMLADYGEERNFYPNSFYLVTGSEIISIMALWKSFHPSVNIAVDQMKLGGGLISSSYVSINEKTLFIYVLTQNIPLKAPDNKSIRLQQFNCEAIFAISRLVELLNHGVFIPTGRILAGNWTRFTMYVLRNIEMSLCNHCCSGRAISITYSECVFVALVWSMNSACFVWHCHLRPVWLYHIFPNYLTKSTIFEKPFLSVKYVLVLPTIVDWNTSHTGKTLGRY